MTLLCIGNLLVVFNYLYFRNRAANFVKICNIYTSWMIIKVAVIINNSDKLSSCYDHLLFVFL